jgi:1,4-alpha-glucan branching enzyme
LVTVTNLRDSYKSGDVIKIRVFSEDRDRDIVFTKLPREKKSQIYHKMYYRVRDFQTGDIVVDFDTSDNSTRLSTDSNGMYFEFFVDSLPKGRTYVFDFLVRKAGFDTIVTDAASKFRVE